MTPARRMGWPMEMQRMVGLMRSLVVSTGSCILGLFLPVAGHAHALESSLRYINGELQLSSNFSTGDAAAGATVRLLQADGSPGKELGQMDSNGMLTLALPAVKQGILDVQIDGGPGHRDYLSLPMDGGVVQLDAVSQEERMHLGWLAVLGAAGATTGLYSGTVLVGRVRRSRMG
ncbi:MAG: hypothetical protein ACON4T_10480 [Synechococcus sp.]